MHIQKVFFLLPLVLTACSYQATQSKNVEIPKEQYTQAAEVIQSVNDASRIELQRKVIAVGKYEYQHEKSFSKVCINNVTYIYHATELYGASLAPYMEKNKDGKIDYVECSMPTVKTNTNTPALGPTS